MSFNESRLREAVESLCLITGDFVLSTGVSSKFYFDCKRATLDGGALCLIADAFLNKINELPEPADAIGGLTMGADFIVAAVTMRAAQLGHPTVRGSVVRKEAKAHGTRSHIENELPAGTRIVVVDDVVTSGSSTRKACEKLLEAGYQIVGILCLVDREAGGLEALATTYGVPARAVLKKSDFPRLAELEAQSEPTTATA